MRCALLVTAMCVSLPLAPGSAGAQVAAADSAARREALMRLAFLAGAWSGPAWYQLPSGGRDTLRQTEHVQLKLRGQVLLVEGIGRRLAGGTPTDTVFSALATIDWVPDRGYTMHSYTLEGRQGTFPLTVSDSGFVWGFEVPGGRIRYTMRLTAEGEWLERGEFSRDGERWFPTLEMRLRRQSPPPGG